MRLRNAFGSRRPSKAADKTAAVLFLTNARSLDHVTPEEFAHRYRIPAREAEYMLAIERQRRARG